MEKFPIFLSKLDKTGFVVKSEIILNTSIEEIDIETKVGSHKLIQFYVVIDEGSGTSTIHKVYKTTDNKWYEGLFSPEVGDISTNSEIKKSIDLYAEIH